MLIIHYPEYYLKPNYFDYKTDVVDIKPTGKWRITNGEFIEIEVSYYLSTLRTKRTGFFSKREKYVERQYMSNWINGDDIYFEEIHEFDCNE